MTLVGWHLGWDDLGLRWSTLLHEQWVASVVAIVDRISHGSNVVVVNNQSENRKKFSLPFDWMLTTTTFAPWDILWTMVRRQAQSRCSPKEGWLTGWSLFSYN